MPSWLALTVIGDTHDVVARITLTGPLLQERTICDGSNSVTHGRARLIRIKKTSHVRREGAQFAGIGRHDVSYKTDKDHPARMRKKALELRERALVVETPGYAEQLIRAAEDLEDYAKKMELQA